MLPQYLVDYQAESRRPGGKGAGRAEGRRQTAQDPWSGRDRPARQNREKAPGWNVRHRRIGPGPGGPTPERGRAFGRVRALGAALDWGQGMTGRPRAGWASPVRTPCLYSSKHPIRSQRGGNNGQTPGEIGFRAPLFWVQVLVRLLLASECPARANAELADNFRTFFRRQKTAVRRWTPGADSGRREASQPKSKGTPRGTPPARLLLP